MKDEQVEQVLQALTQVAAPEGLEERVLRRLAGRRVKAGGGRWWLVPACALGACAVLALAVGMRHRVVSPAVVAPVAATPVVVRPMVRREDVPVVPVARVAGREARHPRVQEAAVSFPAPVAPLTEQEKLLVRLAHAREAEQFEAVAAIREPKEADVALTHEEKLLVAVSHVRRPEVIDALDPVRRAAEEAADDRDFHAFVVSVRPGGF